MMKLPIFIDNRGDISAYASVRDAENDIEAIDVRDNEYEAFDSEGRQLRLIVPEQQRGFWNFGTERVRIAETETEPTRAAALHQRLQAFLKAVGVQNVDAASSLPQIVEATVRFLKPR